MVEFGVQCFSLASTEWLVLVAMCAVAAAVVYGGINDVLLTAMLVPLLVVAALVSHAGLRAFEVVLAADSLANSALGFGCGLLGITAVLIALAYVWGDNPAFVLGLGLVSCALTVAGGTAVALTNANGLGTLPAPKAPTIALSSELPKLDPNSLKHMVAALSKLSPEDFKADGPIPGSAQEKPVRAAAVGGDGKPPAEAQSSRQDPSCATPAASLDKARFVQPANGDVIGNWKAGELLARSSGARSAASPAASKPAKGSGEQIGGNCIGCHQLTPGERPAKASAPSLVGYGRTRKFALAAAQATYARLYDPNALVACSGMPRFGAAGLLTDRQIKDLVALLFDPKSPVNR